MTNWLDMDPALSQPVAGRSATVRRTKRNKRLIDAGIHPATGRAIAVIDETCGSCVHLVAHARSNRYYKCGLVPKTHGPGTDIRLKWPACTLWEEQP